MTIVVALVVFALWTSYRFLFPENLFLDETILKPLIWLLPVFLVTRFKDLGFNRSQIYKNFLIGTTVGLVFSIERLLVSQRTYDFSFIYIISAFFTAVTEEVFFRGYLLNRWLKYFKTRLWLAMIINGLFFTLTHLPIAIFILHYRGYDLFSYLLSIFVSGFINIILFVATGSIYAPVFNHFVWNTFSSLFR